MSDSTDPSPQREIPVRGSTRDPRRVSISADVPDTEEDIVDSGAEEGDADSVIELPPKVTPRGRRSARDADKAKIPAPYDDIFKSSYWPTLPANTASLKSQTISVKLDMIMAYLQDIRLELTGLESGQKKQSLPRSRSNKSAESTNKGSARGSTRRASLPADYAKFQVSQDDIDTFEAQVNSASDYRDVSDVALRLYIMKEPTDCKYNTNVKNCKAAGIKFRDYMLEMGESLDDDVQNDLRTWTEKAAGEYFLAALKERRTQYEEELKKAAAQTVSDDEDMRDDDEAGDDIQQAGSGEDGDDSSEPVRRATGAKSRGKSSRAQSSKISTGARGGGGSSKSK